MKEKEEVVKLRIKKGRYCNICKRERRQGRERARKMERKGERGGKIE